MFWVALFLFLRSLSGSLPLSLSLSLSLSLCFHWEAFIIVHSVSYIVRSIMVVQNEGERGRLKKGEFCIFFFLNSFLLKFLSHSPFLGISFLPVRSLCILFCFFLLFSLSLPNGRFRSLSPRKTLCMCDSACALLSRCGVFIALLFYFLFLLFSYFLYFPSLMILSNSHSHFLHTMKIFCF